MMNWVDGLGWGVGLGVGVGWVGVMCVWCWDSVGRAVDMPTQRYSTYPHPIPIQHHVFPTYPRPHTHHSPHPILTTQPKLPPTIPTIPTLLPPHPSNPAPTLLQPTRPNPRPYPQPCVYYSTPNIPYPLLTRPTSTPKPNPYTPPYTLYILSYTPNLTPPTPICPPRRKDSHQS